MRNACDSDSRCGLACDASARDAKSLAMRVERCEPLREGSFRRRGLFEGAHLLEFLTTNLERYLPECGKKQGDADHLNTSGSK